MAESLYMLMVLDHDDGPHGATFWAAARVDGERALTKQQIEAALPRLPHRRFVFPYTEQTKDFGPASGPAPTLAIPPGETIWQYGEPTLTDSIDVLKTLADGAASPIASMAAVASLFVAVAAVVVAALR